MPNSRGFLQQRASLCLYFGEDRSSVRVWIRLCINLRPITRLRRSISLLGVPYYLIGPVGFIFADVCLNTVVFVLDRGAHTYPATFLNSQNNVATTFFNAGEVDAVSEVIRRVA